MEGNINKIISRNFLERSLIIIKPDGVRRGLMGEIIKRLESPGLQIIGIKMVKITRQFAKNHYTYEDIAVRHGENIREQLLDYITEGPVAAMVVEGINCIEVVRKICGSTEPAKSPPGTIRGDFCHQSYAYCNKVGKAIRNVIHASANLEDAKREVELWFKPEELWEYSRSDHQEHL